MERRRQPRIEPQQPVCVKILDESGQHLDAVVHDAIDRGAKVLIGGTRPKDLTGGYYYMPTVLGQVAKGSSVVRDEPFGPIAPIQRFSTEEEVLKMANDTMYGLQAAVYTMDIGRAFRVARGLHAGGVHLNDPTSLRWDALPFGGMKSSGLGREGLRYAMEEMTEVKTISVNVSQV